MPAGHRGLLSCAVDDSPKLRRTFVHPSRDRDAEPEGGGFRGAADAEGGSHLRGEHGGDGEANAEVFAVAGAGEGFEDVLQLLRGNRGSGVPDENIDTAGTAFRDGAGRQDIEGGRTGLAAEVDGFGGIEEEVAEDFLEAAAVDIHRRHVRGDVDLEGHTVRVRKTLVRQGGELVRTPPKSKKSERTVPLSDAALTVLRRLKKRHAEDKLRAGSKWHETGFVFVTEFGEPCDPRNALRALQVAAESTGMKGVGLHTLRHTAATMMLNAGIPMSTVSRIMGHASIAVTVDLYGHVSPDVARDAFDALGAAWTASADG